MKDSLRSGVPNKDIIAAKGKELSGKLILLGITGSPAAVESVELARELMRHGAEVVAVVTPASMNLVHPNLFEWATGNAPVTRLTGRIEHILYTHSTGRQADLLLIAPCTANTIGKIVTGIDDSTVTSIATAAIGEGIPIIIAPAMHDSMWKNPFILENLQRIRDSKIELVEPRLEEGKAKIATTDMIVEAVLKRLSTKDLKGRSILVTAGPTIEYIDPIRLITNKSSGKMGVALAKMALRKGAQVTLVYGPGEAIPPQGAKVVRVETTEEMFKAVKDELTSHHYDVAVLSAAASDFIPTEKALSKISTSTTRHLNLHLKTTPKILDEVKKLSPQTFLIAFKAEYDMKERELVERGFQRLRESRADLMVVNDVSLYGAGFGAEANQVLIVDRNRRVKRSGLIPKEEVAEIILNETVSRLKELKYPLREGGTRSARRVTKRLT